MTAVRAVSVAGAVTRDLRNALPGGHYTASEQLWDTERPVEFSCPSNGARASADARRRRAPRAGQGTQRRGLLASDDAVCAQAARQEHCYDAEWLYLTLIREPAT